MVDNDDKQGTMPVGVTTCVDCHRVVKAAHVNMDGQCSICSGKAVPIALPPNQLVDPMPISSPMATEEDLAGTYDALQPAPGTGAEYEEV